MLLNDRRQIGNRLFAIRKRNGMTQAEIAELAGLSNRTYADIERGTVNMRVDTMQRICSALHITPDEILTVENNVVPLCHEEILARLNSCSPKDQETAFAILEVYLRSIVK